AETDTLARWLTSGAGGPPPASDADDPARADVAKWEAFLDADDPRARLVARYVFEHLFFAHLEFESARGAWYRLGRSRTAAPAPIDEIATVRPYDDPGVTRVHYRLRRLRESIVQKTHVPYALSDAKLARLRRIFFEADWGGAPVEQPSYTRDVAA